VTLTTTLQRLRRVGACPDRYAHLVRALGDAASDQAAPINLLDILKHNGHHDCLWALRATCEDSSRVARELAAAIAENVLDLYERVYPGDLRLRSAIAAARYLACDAARAVACADAADAAAAAASDAVSDAARAGAARAALAAASAAASAAAVAAAVAVASAASDGAISIIIARHLAPAPEEAQQS